MVLPYFRLAALGVVVSGILSVPAPARERSVAALSAVGFPIVGGSTVEMSRVRPAGATAAPASVHDAATALSRAGKWSTAGVVVTGAVATLVLRDASGAMQASLIVPARAITASGLRAGDAVRTTATEAGTILHRDGRVLAFVAADDQDHLVQHDALVVH
ncbi:hypothetical protein [Vineibacter terrae]|uniref:hypothetical protein n=1 Tax=Vineibacter terrae TaxID=2586908 RepID=UPI002E382313|nr:hypothetical protein [Vineibacter terrae]HEX2890985.1 hypothetical protein [Vineibacter terrae]